ncbi:MAG: serine hydrolase, partial [Gemmatimonadota bacterium]
TILAQRSSPLGEALARRVAHDSATIGLVFRDLQTGETLSVNPDLRFHAASTMKIPVLIELARRIDAGDGGWTDSMVVSNRFHSIVDGSEYQLNLADDSDSSLYSMEGKSLSIETLARLMITRSSNLATNLIIGRLDATRVNATAHQLGADSIEVRRGVEDQKAFDRGLNNTTTARDLASLLAAIASGGAASVKGTRTMLELLLAQEFNDGIPAGLPAGTRVAHKTGEITGISHDAAVVYPPGRKPYVLVILTKGYADRKDAMRLMADVSRMIFDAVGSRR